MANLFNQDFLEFIDALNTAAVEYMLVAAMAPINYIRAINIESGKS